MKMSKFVVILSWCVVVVVALWAYPELNRCKIYMSPWRDQDKLFSGGLLLLATIFAFFATFYYLKKRKGKAQWVYRWNKEKPSLVLAESGSWEAQLARDVYSKGQVFIFSKEETPNFLGDKKIPEPENLVRLIEEISIVMVKVVPNCERVYLASLSESGTLHFWLIPKNDSEHQDFLDSKDAEGRDNDGFTLIADLRNNFVDRKKGKKPWDSMPPCPEVDREKWLEYAEDYEKKFKTYAEAMGSC